ncbi:hypothetical protein U472_00365 [Orenia metallireducens]|jgi:hypothetical protein|uniref:Uncharacterized protein n=1 Tax=Orenia metallireducens TaxID=1413210 RepID=A0A1C0ADA5_9FIRM|nr:hypothetical protein [Orenia metallireducens]OCL28644.1 hypothetical protein U472_00365 [Orenia metallireducens]
MSLKDILNQEDIQFLQDLGRELKEQDNHCTAKPLIFNVYKDDLEFGVDPDFGGSDLYAIVEAADPENAIYSDDIEEMQEFVKDYSYDNDIEIKEINSPDDYKEFLEENEIEYYISYIRKKKVKENAFLTEKAAWEHVKGNKHHYNRYGEPKVYCSHGWRNPELKKLLEIIEKFADLDELEE